MKPCRGSIRVCYYSIGDTMLLLIVVDRRLIAWMLQQAEDANEL